MKEAIQNKLPQGWSEKSLHECVNFVRGVTFPSDAKSKFPAEGKIGVLRTANIQKEVEWKDLWFVDEKYLSREEQVVRHRDIIISNANSYELIGKVSFVKKIPTKSTLGTFITLIRTKTENDPNFIYYYLSTKGFQNEVQALSSTTTNISNVSVGKLQTISIPLPPLATQKKVVAKLEKLFADLDQNVAQLTEAKKKLKIYRQSVLKFAFEGKLTGTDQSEMKWLKLHNVGKVSGGITKNSKRERLPLKLPFLRVANVYFNQLELDNVHTIGLRKEEVERATLKKDDLIFVEGNGSIEQIGRVALWNGSIENCVHQNHLIKVRLSKTVLPKFALYFFCSKLGRDEIKAQANSTSGLHTLSLGKIEKLELPTPSLKTQDKIVCAIESRLSVADTIEQQVNASLKQAEILRQSILKEAFEGRLLVGERIALPKPYTATGATIAQVPPKPNYFQQTQTIAFIHYYSTNSGVQHGDMTLAKYTYLMDRLYGINMGYEYKHWHLGPYAPEINKVIKNKKFFKHSKGGVELLNPEKLLKYNNRQKETIEEGVKELTSIFNRYPEKDRAHKTELFATVCKVVEDIKVIELKAVRQSMAEWKIELANSRYKNKAQKFSEEETKKCLKFIVGKGWDKKLVKAS